MRGSVSQTFETQQEGRNPGKADFISPWELVLLVAQDGVTQIPSSQPLENAFQVSLLRDGGGGWGGDGSVKHKE